MYSLYRAWFGATGAEEAYPRLEGLSPPDTVVRVGNEAEYHFVAHRAVLAAHSGYLKALLAAAPGPEGPAAEGAPALITSVTVPSTVGNCRGELPRGVKRDRPSVCIAISRVRWLIFFQLERCMDLLSGSAR